MGWLMVYFVYGCLGAWYGYYMMQNHPEIIHKYQDKHVDNPMLSSDFFIPNTELEKVQMNMLGNRALYHHVFRYVLYRIYFIRF